jgi:hypothetical protein
MKRYDLVFYKVKCKVRLICQGVLLLVVKAISCSQVSNPRRKKIKLGRFAIEIFFILHKRANLGRALQVWEQSFVLRTGLR